MNQNDPRNVIFRGRMCLVIESLESAQKLVMQILDQNVPLSDDDSVTLGNAANQATQAARDLNQMCGFLHFERHDT